LIKDEISIQEINTIVGYCGLAVTARELSQFRSVWFLLSIYTFLAYCSLTISIFKQQFWEMDAPLNTLFFLYVLVLIIFLKQVKKYLFSR